MNKYGDGNFIGIEEPMGDLLLLLHEQLSLPWAWSIIALTVVVRLLIFPITAKQTRSTLAMQRLSPYLKQLQQKHKDDRQALNVATMEFYRDNKVNPLASCFPLLLQIPIFTGLFFLLQDFEPPKGSSADFSFLWGFVHNIQSDINGTDPAVSGWILLLFYVASQMLSSHTMMNTTDPKQRMLFMALPVVFVPFIINFPVGVMLYWITTNLWSLGQYLLVVWFAQRGEPAEVILPADSKGRKKVIIPKDEKVKAANRDKQGSKGSRKASGGQKSKAKAGGAGSKSRGGKKKR